VLKVLDHYILDNIRIHQIEGWNEEWTQIVAIETLILVQIILLFAQNTLKKNISMNILV